MKQSTEEKEIKMVAANGKGKAAGGDIIERGSTVVKDSDDAVICSNLKKIKNKNGSVHVGNIINNFDEKKWEELIAKITKDIMQRIDGHEKLVKTIVETVVAKVETVCADLIKEQGINKLSLENIQVTITELEKKEGDIKNDILSLLNGIGNDTEQIQETLTIYKKEVEFQVKQTDLVLTQIEHIGGKLESFSVDIKNASTLFEKFMNTSGEQYSHIIDCIQGLANKSKEESQSIVDSEIKKMDNMLTILRDTNVKQDKILEMESVNNAILKRMEKMLADVENQFRETSNDNEKEALRQKIASLEALINELKVENEAFRRNGECSDNPCPFCGSIEPNGRILKNGQCECSLCGKWFVDINPTVQQAKECADWKEIHCARLIDVSNGEEKGLYRISLKEDTVNRKGILIIPNEAQALDTETVHQVNQIRFCEPFTGDDETVKELKKVKTIILKSGVNEGIRDNKHPFKWRAKIERIIKWDENNCEVEREERGEYLCVKE